MVEKCSLQRLYNIILQFRVIYITFVTHFPLTLFHKPPIITSYFLVKRNLSFLIKDIVINVERQIKEKPKQFS